MNRVKIQQKEIKTEKFFLLTNFFLNRCEKEKLDK